MSGKVLCVILLAGLMLFLGCEREGKVYTGPMPDEAKMNAQKPVAISYEAVQLVELAGQPQITEAGKFFSMQVPLKAKVDLNWPAVNFECIVRGGGPRATCVGQAKGPVQKDAVMQVTFEVPRVGLGTRILEIVSVHEGKPGDTKSALPERGGGHAPGAPPAGPKGESPAPK